MDNVTHTLTGLMLSRAGLKRGVPRASLLLMVAANIPDIDAVSILSPQLADYLHYHRYLTHALPMAPMLALLPVALVWLLAHNNFPWRRAYLVSLAGVLSHLLLDWTNIYGIRLLLPFSGRWLRLDTTTVVDLWIWLLLGIGFLWPLLASLVSTEIGAQSNAGAGIARFALAALLIYDGGRFVLHQRAVALLDARLHAGENPIQVAALPFMGSPLHWTGLVQIPNGYVVHDMNLAKDFDPTAGKVYYQAEPSPLIEKAKATKAFQVFLDFSSFPLWRVTRLPQPEGAVQVEANDMRFGLPGAGRFTAICLFDAAGSVQRSWFQLEAGGSTPSVH